MSQNTFDALDGALLIDKPSGPTSHDIVDIVRRSYRIKKVGHCGTLDPNATGFIGLHQIWSFLERLPEPLSKMTSDDDSKTRKTTSI